jgi:hypothetical protein
MTRKSRRRRRRFWQFALLAIGAWLNVPGLRAAMVIMVIIIALMAMGGRNPRRARAQARASELLLASSVSRDRARNLTARRATASVSPVARADADELARSLDRALGIARELTGNANLARELTRAGVQARGLSRALSRGSRRPRTRDAASARALRRAISRAHRRGSRVRALSRDPAGRALISYMESAGVLAGALDSHLTRARVFGRSANDADVRARERARRQSTVRAKPDRGPVTVLAGKLIRTATSFLPAADQARYAEEYRAELWDLAHAGAPRRRQIVYACRQLGSSLALRRALRTSRRQGT